MKQVYFRGISLAAALAILLFGAMLVQAAPPAQDAEESVVDVIQANEELSLLAGALATTGLDATLAGDGPFTVFAPDNAAFEALPDDVPTDLAALTDILLYHVVPGELDPASGVAATALGDELTLSGEGEDLTVNGVDVGETAAAASNGAVYIIDSVLALPNGQEEDAAEGAAAEGAGEEDAAVAEEGAEEAAEGTEEGAEEAADTAAEDAAAVEEGAEEAADTAAEDVAAVEEGAEEAVEGAEEGAEEAAAEEAAAESGDAAAEGEEGAEAAAQVDDSGAGSDEEQANLAERSGRSRSEYKDVWKRSRQHRSLGRW